MDMNVVKEEILNRMNMRDFSLTSNDMIDIMNIFDINEEQLGLAYNAVVSDQMEELNDTGDYIMDYFRDKGNHYPSFDSFKDEFEKNYQVSDNIIRRMYKKQIEDENQLSLFEVIKQEVAKAINEDREFNAAAARIKKDWGGDEIPDEKLNPEDLFGDESMIAISDIEDEYGEEEIAPFGSMEDPKKFVDDVTGELSEDDDPCWDGYEKVPGKKYYEDGSCKKKTSENIDEVEEGVDVTPPGLIKVSDSEGNQIKRHMIVKPVDGADKAGRVTGFGDDGQGNLIVLVDWQWPIDMKHTNPEEMGKDKVRPEDVVVRSPKMEEESKHKTKETMEGDNTEMVKETKMPETIERFERLSGMLGKENIAELILFKLDDDTANSVLDSIEQDHNIRNQEDVVDESGRGLGKGVKNSGDRNVKQREDGHSAPLTNLNESIDGKIKKLFEGSVKKKDLINFVKEEADNYAKTIREKSK